MGFLTLFHQKKKMESGFIQFSFRCLVYILQHGGGAMVNQLSTVTTNMGAPIPPTKVKALDDGGHWTTIVFSLVFIEPRTESILGTQRSPQ